MKLRTKDTMASTPSTSMVATRVTAAESPRPMATVRGLMSPMMMNKVNRDKVMVLMIDIINNNNNNNQLVVGGHWMVMM